MIRIMFSMLIDLKSIKNIEGTTFIYSLWEGYLRDYSLQKMMRFIKKKNMNFCQVHTSGHAGIDTLKKMVTKLKPLRIIPIHTLGIIIDRRLKGRSCKRES